VTEPRDAWSRGQRLAEDQLQALQDASGGAVEVLEASLVPEHAIARFEVSLDVGELAKAPGGIKVRSRERFVLAVPEDFPSAIPQVLVRHRRWAGTAHVQWGNVLCLFAAPSTEWLPADGMRGLIDRLALWLVRAAAGDLDPDGQPLHPPVAYVDSAAGPVVVRADVATDAPWAQQPRRPWALLVAVCSQDDDRLDVLRWIPFGRYLSDAGRDGPPADEQGRPYVLAAAVLVDTQIGFEYPETARALADGLAAGGVNEDDLLELVATVADANARTAADRGVSAVAEGEQPDHGPGGSPLVLLVGTPSRRMAGGPPLTHLVAWRLDDLAGRITGLLGSFRPGRSDALDELRGTVLQLGRDLFDFADVSWARVHEDRAEVTVRRDGGSSAAWLYGKKVLVLGCGALGAPIAEMCVRAGAAVTVVDKGVVTPGILVRQPYRDRDIGKAKAVVLARRLRGLRQGAQAVGQAKNAVKAHLRPGQPVPEFDLIVDATADSAVRAALEHARGLRRAAWPPLLTVLVGHESRRGVVAVSRAGASGAGHDVLRKLGIAVRTTHAESFRDVAQDLYPAEARTDVFLPEPGCSSPTFVGSAVEANALASGLFSVGLDALLGRAAGPAEFPLCAAAVRLNVADPKTDQPGSAWIGWPDDAVVDGAEAGLPVRISPTALATVRAEARRGERIRGPLVETGGMLLGQIDEAVGTVYVDVATVPPGDSLLGERHFQHGVLGSQDLVDHHRRRTAGATGFVGMWHTHPHGRTDPSPTDEDSMTSLVTPVTGGASRALILIFGGGVGEWTRWLGDTSEATAVPAVYARLVRRASSGAPTGGSTADDLRQDLPPGSYYPGGWGPPPGPPRRSRIPWPRRHGRRATR
jgi:integrative and conjugative element protein (TIGR02256 family)